MNVVPNTRICPSCSRKVSFFAMTRSGVCEDCASNHGANAAAEAPARMAQMKAEILNQIATRSIVEWTLVPPAIIEDLRSLVLVTTTNEIAGYRIAEVVKIVGAETALGMHMFRDLANTLRDAFGGRSATIQNALRINRQTCISEMQQEALIAGADAVVGIKLDYSEFSSSAVTGGMLFTAATGTAVRLDRVPVRSTD